MQNIEQGTNSMLKGLFLISLALSVFTMFYLLLHQSLWSAAWFLLTISALLATLVGYYLQYIKHPQQLLLQFCLLITLWGVMIAHAGGAMSSTNALQLILVALIYFSLPLQQALLASAFMLAFQAYYLYNLLSVPNEHEHQAHFIGMSLSFILAAVILAFVTSTLKKALANRQNELAALREEQLRQEQIMALATATVQITHELATPLNTLSLWVDEISEGQQATPEYIAQITPPLQRMQSLLNDLRSTAQAIHEDRFTYFALPNLLLSLKNQVNLQFPTAQVQWQFTSEHTQQLLADHSLLPALLNLIRNAIQHTFSTSTPIEVQSTIKETSGQSYWHLSIENKAPKIPTEVLQLLGRSAIQSEQGLGIGTLLSHATLERFGGTLNLYYQQETLTQSVCLPVQKQPNRSPLASPKKSTDKQAP